MTASALPARIARRAARLCLRPVGRLAAHRIETACRERIQAVMWQLASQGICFDARDALERQGCTVTGSGSILVQASGPEGGVMLRIPLTSAAAAGLVRHARTLACLNRLPGFRDYRHLIPRPLAWDHVAGSAFYAETAVPGRAATALARDPAARACVTARGAGAIAQLHRVTSRQAAIDDHLLERIVDRRAEVVSRSSQSWADGSEIRRKLGMVAEALSGELRGRECCLTWSHGDLWPGNLLADSVTGELTGIVDWDRAAVRELPTDDILHLVAYSRKAERRTEVGEEVARALRGCEDAPGRDMVEAAAAAAGFGCDARALRSLWLLYWLRFAAANLAMYPGYARDGAWVSRNIRVVLECALSSAAGRSGS